MFSYQFLPYASCGAHTADPIFHSLRWFVVGVTSDIEKCYADLRGERLFLQFVRKLFDSSLQVFCIELFEIAFVECFEIAFVEVVSCGARVVSQTCTIEAKWVPKCTINHTK